MKILAIDPGNERSAYVLYEHGTILAFDTTTNKVILERMPEFKAEYIDEMAIEMIASYGMSVGKSIFDTCVWIGRFIQRWDPKPWSKVYRHDVKMHLCHSMKAKDGNVRQALIDLYPPSGGGKCPQIGTVKQKGPLYGVSGDVWSALAVAVTFDAPYNEIVNRGDK